MWQGLKGTKRNEGTRYDTNNAWKAVNGRKRDIQVSNVGRQ